MMKKTTKPSSKSRFQRGFALALALILCPASLPVSAFAADADDLFAAEAAETTVITNDDTFTEVFDDSADDPFGDTAEDPTESLFTDEETTAVSTETTGTNVAYHTQDEIRAYIQASNARITDPVTYKTQPVTAAPYNPGVLSDATLDSAIRMLNQVRYIAGVSPNVVLSDAYNEPCQAGALLNYVNNTLSHNPAKPTDMDEALYQLGRNGCNSSNLAGGSGISITSYPLNKFIQLWMSDSDPGNMANLGHRRWLLNPAMGATGFGYAGSENRCYSSVYAFDTSNSSASEYGVMWPAQNMPASYFDPKDAWSVSTGEYLFDSKIQVTLTRTSDGRVWNFPETGWTEEGGYLNVSNNGYGQPGCIIFRPDGIESYNNGDSFNVSITKDDAPYVNYTVNFFYLDPCERGHLDEHIEYATKDNPMATRTCNACGKTETFAVSDRFIAFWRPCTATDNVYSSAFPSSFSEGDYVQYMIGNGDGNNLDPEFLIGDTSLMSYKPSEARFDMKKGGTTTLTVRLKYRPCISRTYKVNINHSFDAGTITKEPTCTEEGIRLFTCPCGDTLEEPIAALPHSLVKTNATAATCTTDGNKEYWTCSACKNVFSDADGKNPTTVADMITKATGHTSVTDAAVAPTCTSDGLTEGAHCSVCNTVLKAQKTVAALGHDDGVLTNQKEASCAKEGYTGDLVCSRCGKLLEKGTSIPTTGKHTLTKHNGKAPTCTSDGNIEYWSCSDCSKVFEDEAGTTEITLANVIIMATGHTVVIDKGYPATCIEEGYTDGSHCSVCKRILKRQELIPATGHTVVIDKGSPATCIEEGYTDGSHCSVCKRILKRQELIPATGHRFGSWATTKRATALASGQQKRTCSACGEPEYKTLPKLKATVKLNASGTLPLKRGQSFAAKATGLAYGDKIVKWTSSNSKIASVSKTTGKVKASTTRTGTATIKVTLKSGKTASFKVRVQKTSVKTTAIKNVPKTITLKRGTSIYLKPDLSPVTSLEKKTYSSSRKSVATVSSTGKITAKKRGTTTITVKAGTKKVNCKVTVK